MNRPAYVYALAVVGAFVTLGAGVGLAANFTLGFFIEQFVDPGDPPLESTQVGIMFLVAIFFTYGLGPVAAGVAGIGVGQAMPDRETAAGIVAGVGSFAGFYLFVGLSLFFTLAVLSEYGSGATGGGGGGGGPLDPAGLGKLVVQVSLPVGLVGMGTGYIASRVSSGPAEEDDSVLEDDDVVPGDDDAALDGDDGMVVEEDGDDAAVETTMEPAADQ